MKPAAALFNAAHNSNHRLMITRMRSRRGLLADHGCRYARGCGLGRSAGQVCQQRVQLGDGQGAIGRVEPLLELVYSQPVICKVVAQRGDRAVSLQTDRYRELAGFGWLRHGVIVSSSRY